jgi:hypothetical protein
MKTERDDILEMNKKRDLRGQPSKSRYNQALELKMIVDGATRDP